MFQSRLSYWSGLALTAAVAVGNIRTARAVDPAPTQPSQQQLLDKINSLQSQVNELKQSTQQQNQDTTANALQHDADKYGQFQLLQEGSFTAGYNDGRFVIQSADKRYVFRPWLQLQLRYETTHRDDGKYGGAVEDTQTGFEIRRLKFGFDGNIIAPNLTYMLQFAVDRKTGVLSLEQAFGKYRIDSTPFYIKGGQYKEFFDHEQILASRYLTALERTLSNDLFSNSEGFVQGISLGFDNGGAFRGEVAFTDGQRSANTGFQQFPNGNNTANFGGVGRAEFKAFGNWKDYDRSTGAYAASDNFLVFGGTADYTEAGDTHNITHIADVDFGTKSGFGFYGAYTGRSFTHAAPGSIGTNGGTTGKTIGTNGYDWSIRTQASYAINAQWEPYAQYEFIHLDGRNLPAGARNEIQVIRAGVNYYLYKTEARLTFDVNYLPDGSPISDDGIGLLATGKATKQAGFTHGGGSEVIFRAQFQLNL